MATSAPYGDDRRFELPDGWEPVAPEVLATALGQSVAALTDDAALADLKKFYDRAGNYAGTLFLDVTPNTPDRIEASDLYAVTTLSMELTAQHGRLLLDEGDTRADIRDLLRRVDSRLPITDLEAGQGGSAETLRQMEELYVRVRTLLGERSNWWVFGAKLCARKRPRLFPVRDNWVCEYLGQRKLKRGDGWPGDFRVDIQVYAYLATSPAVVAALGSLRSQLTETGHRPDDDNLRLLDSALWMAAGRTRATKGN